MTTRTLPMTTIPDVTGTGRWRPWHYVIVTREVDTDDESNLWVYDVEVTDSEDSALTEAAARNTGFMASAGVFDNGTGYWLIKPDWAEETKLDAEGPTPYYLRPEGAR